MLRTRPVAILIVLGVAWGSALPGPVSAEDRPAERASALRPDTIRVATFNVLGSQHTAGPGGYAPGKGRARITSRLIERKTIDLIALQEVQADQLLVFKHELQRYRIWPGYQLGRAGLRLQIAWRTSRFELLDTGTLVTKFDGRNRPVPWVLLRNHATQRRIYVLNLHNSPRRMERERDLATGRQIKLVRALRRTGISVLVLGDFNEREEAFCRFVGGTDLRAPNGGSVSKHRCRPPNAPLRVDWIFGRGRFRFDDYVQDRGRQVRKASDHALVRAVLTIRPPRQGG